VSRSPLVRRILFDGLLFLCNRIVGRIPSHTLRLAFYGGVMRFAIGDKASIFSGAQFTNRGSFAVGDHTTINEDCRLDNRGGLTIGSHVSISPQVCILTADHDPQDPQFRGRERAVRIEDYVFVGTRAMILPGVTLLRGAVVAAAAVVTHDVEPLSIVAGSPAREIRKRNPDLAYDVGYRRLFA